MPPTEKFVVSVTGNTRKELLLAADKEAETFYADNEGHVRAVSNYISTDPDYQAFALVDAIAKAKKQQAESDDPEVEVIPAEIKRYDATVEFEFVPENPNKRKTLNDVWNENDAAREAAPRPENDPRYQESYE